MPSQFRVRVESHAGAAFVYLSGPLTTAGARQTLRAWQTLPPAVRLLRVDLRSATLSDPGPIAALSMLLNRWRLRDARRHTRLDLPPLHRRPQPVPMFIARRTTTRAVRRAASA